MSRLKSSAIGGWSCVCVWATSGALQAGMERNEWMLLAALLALAGAIGSIAMAASARD